MQTRLIKHTAELEDAGLTLETGKKLVVKTGEHVDGVVSKKE
jgi:uncharacterized protein YlzI (FlbEa/FlbD family)